MRKVSPWCAQVSSSRGGSMRSLSSSRRSRRRSSALRSARAQMTCRRSYAATWCAPSPSTSTITTLHVAPPHAHVSTWPHVSTWRRLTPMCPRGADDAAGPRAAGSALATTFAPQPAHAERAHTARDRHVARGPLTRTGVRARYASHRTVHVSTPNRREHGAKRRARGRGGSDAPAREEATHPSHRTVGHATRGRAVDAAAQGRAGAPTERSDCRDIAR